jgi:hypothetical protein
MEYGLKNYIFLMKFLFFRIDDWRLLKSQTELDLCNLTVGELLKKKAEDGVRVLLMIWGETTSIMGTHDTETDNFFKGRQRDYISDSRAHDHTRVPVRSVFRIRGNLMVLMGEKLNALQVLLCHLPFQDLGFANAVELA